MIDKFELNSQCYEHINVKDDKWNQKFTQINFNEHQEFRKENETLRKLFEEAIYEYKKVNNINDVQFPRKFIFEPIRMKRYMPNSDDRFDKHVDVSDLDSSRRFLVMFIYLNDDFEGGETVFNQLNKAVKPIQSNMIIFPPMWAWLHTANSVKGQNPKYILGTYMHYV